MHALRGYWHFGSGRPSEYLVELDKARKLYEDYSFSDELIKILADMAKAYLQQGLNDKALAATNKATKQSAAVQLNHCKRWGIRSDE